MRVVLDTNVIVSGVRFGGKPQLVLDAMGLADYTLISSERILTELEIVLSGKFRWSPEVVDLALERIRTLADMVDPPVKLADCRDPDDDRILEVAVAGRADCIVTGDDDLLSMKIFRGVEILTVSDFLERLGQPKPGRQA